MLIIKITVSGQLLYHMLVKFLIFLPMFSFLSIPRTFTTQKPRENIQFIHFFFQKTNCQGFYRFSHCASPQ